MNREIYPSDLSIYSFGPIADAHSKLLILGSIPGKESLKMNFYYAHPQNAFWKIMFILYNQSYSADNEFRKELLLQNGIALWDVIGNCKRESSLDTDIRMENPNDLPAFLFTHPGISKIFFNGKASAKYFNKYFPHISLDKKILPSTSPAHAIKWEKKLEAWREIKDIAQR